MIEKQIPATEKVAKLRSMGFVVEERRVEKWHGEECFHVWEWQLKTGDDTWISALSLFDDIIRDKMSCLVMDSITRFYNPQIEMFARFKMKSSFHKTKRII